MQQEDVQDEYAEDICTEGGPDLTAWNPQQRDALLKAMAKVPTTEQVAEMPEPELLEMAMAVDAQCHVGAMHVGRILVALDVIAEGSPSERRRLWDAANLTLSTDYRRKLFNVAKDFGHTPLCVLPVRTLIAIRAQSCPKVIEKALAIVEDGAWLPTAGWAAAQAQAEAAKELAGRMAMLAEGAKTPELINNGEAPKVKLANSQDLPKPAPLADYTLEHTQQLSKMRRTYSGNTKVAKLIVELQKAIAEATPTTLAEATPTTLAEVA